MEQDVVRTPYRLHARLLTVARVEDLSPTMRRISVSGPELEPGLPYVRGAVADHVKVVIPDEATGRVTLPRVGEHGLVPGPSAVRTYTIRSFSPERRELTLDFVLHPHGPAGRWAARARPGDPVGVLGPRGSTRYPAGYAHYVIAADQTGLPAAERWIEEAPRGAGLDVFILVPDAGAERTLPFHPRLRLHWLHQDAGADLGAAAREAAMTAGLSSFVWAAAEATALAPLRRLLPREGFERRQLSLHGYWKAGETDHHEHARAATG